MRKLVFARHVGSLFAGDVVTLPDETAAEYVRRQLASYADDAPPPDETHTAKPPPRPAEDAPAAAVTAQADDGETGRAMTTEAQVEADDDDEVSNPAGRAETVEPRAGKGGGAESPPQKPTRRRGWRAGRSGEQ